MIKKSFILIVAALFFSGYIATAAELRIKAIVETTDVSVGEPFILQLQVSGADNPQQPDMSVIKDFNVVFQGGQQNSSSSITIINGKVTKDVRGGYYFSYQLTPTRSGSLTIPSLSVKAGSNSAETDAIQISAREPSETEDFKLRLSLSRDRCYVGEPVILTATWYIGKDVRDFNFTLPVLSDSSFKFADTDNAGQQGSNAYRIPVGNGEVTGVKGKGSLDGRDFTTITFKKVLIPVRAGDIGIRPATVSCSTLVGYQQRRDDFNNDFFRDFFNDNSFGGTLKTVVVPSNSLTLKVLDLPDKGRPSDFNGHVGKYIIIAEAAPTNVSVGDPITLTLTLMGPDYLENVRMPALEKQTSLAWDFKIPSESAGGQIEGKAKVFTQTIRPLRADVKEIPSIELPYFDTGTQTYKVAVTKSIPIVVKSANVITANDAEGSAGQTLTGSEVETLNRGIASNYDDESVIRNAALEPVSILSSSLWKVLILASPFIYLLLLTGNFLYRRRNGDLMKLNSRKAYGRLLSALKETRNSASINDGCAMVQEALRNYLCDKLNISGKAAMTFNDIKERLTGTTISMDTINALDDLFKKCEAGRYAGMAGTSDVDALTGQAETLAKEIEKVGEKPNVKSTITKQILTIIFSVTSFFILGMMFNTVHAVSLDDAQISTLYTEAKNYFKQANETATKYPDEAHALYIKAAMRYESIIKDGGIHNGRIYYNLGNIYFQMKDIGRAILNYRRAMRYTPNDAMLKQNLNYAKERRQDKIEDRQETLVLKTLFFWHYDLSQKVRLILFFVFFILMWGIACVRIFIKRPFMGWSIASLAALSALFAGSLTADEISSRKSHPGVIISSEVVARKGNSETYEPSFKEPLHSGTEFTLLEDRGDWVNIELTDARSCWVPEKAIELVR
jgi:tetratricopeptide (TPR) repeat protein